MAKFPLFCRTEKDLLELEKLCSGRWSFQRVCSVDEFKMYLSQCQMLIAPDLNLFGDVHNSKEYASMIVFCSANNIGITYWYRNSFTLKTWQRMIAFENGTTVKNIFDF